MLSLADASARILTSRLSRLAAGLLVGGLLAVAWATPAAAASDSRLSLTVSSRWNVSRTPGAWTAYLVQVRNDGGTTFNGEVRLVPNPSRFGPFPPFQSVPEYRAAVSVPGGAERETPLYVIEPPGGYHAELRDQQGSLVARANPQAAVGMSAAVAVLSDAPQAGQRVDAALRTLTRTGVAVSQFSSVQAFPGNAVYLTGLNGLVVDQLGSAALSPAQVQAIEDFVGLGGALVLVGGASWRRAMLPLPAELLPLRPTGTASASLAPMAELAGLTSTAVVQVTTGEVASWARVTMTSPDGQPLVVEGQHGAGHVVTLTLDPLAPPLDTQLDLSALSWNQAISRALSGARAGSQFNFGPPTPSSTLRGSGPGSWSPRPDLLDQVLNGMPAPSPQFGLLVLLLVGYALTVSLLSYVVLKLVGHRGLLWVIAPVVAITFTAASYEVGFGGRSTDYRTSAIEILRPGPDGEVETYRLDAIMAPRRGDFRVTGQANVLASTAISTFGPVSSDNRDALISVGPRPEVVLANVPVWDVRPVVTLAVTHDSTPVSGSATPVSGSAMPIEVALRVQQGRIKGEVTNRGGRTVRDLRLVSGTGTSFSLLPALASGTTATVDAALPANPFGPGVPPGKFAVAVAIGGPVFPGNGADPLVGLAASQVNSGAGDLALVASTDPIGTLRVDGHPPSGSTRTMLVEPVQLQSADSLSAIAPRARLVSSYSGTGADQVDVYELELPRGLAGRVGLAAATFGPPGVSADVYDWNLRTWRTVVLTTPTPLAAGETSGGVIRVRIHASGSPVIVLSATSLP